jgi:SAM-dependent methyltransferase
MFSHYEGILARLNADPDNLASERFRDELLRLPVELWGHLLWKSAQMWKYPKLTSLAPELPPLDVQARFVGGSGEKMLPRNADYMRMFEAGVAISLARPMRNLRILDYGCGWGRLSRYFLRYCAPGDLVSVDPDRQMVDLLTTQKFPADIRLIPAIPDETDIGRDFDVVNLYSVFTHLPDWLVRDVMRKLRGVMKKDGVVVFTIRAPEFWPYYLNHTKDDRFASCSRQHSETGYAFVPFKLDNGRELPNYGDSSFSAEHLLALMPDWEVLKTDLCSSDPFQIVYFVKPITE